MLQAIRMSSALEAETKKFQHLYEGPYIIKKCIHWDTFLLVNIENRKERGIFNLTLLKPYYSRI